MRKFIQKKRKGSLLLEALLSIVILSVSITLIIQAMTASLRAMRVISEYGEGLVLLENKMTEVIKGYMLGENLNIAETSISSDEKYQYTFEIDPRDEEGLGDLDAVNLNISWKTGRKESNVTLETYLIRPEQ